jgi:DNA-binding IclR family transcriptional regulator
MSADGLTIDEETTGAATNASEKTLLVLEAAFVHSRFTDIVEATGLAKATTHRILATLQARQFVVVSADGGYLPGPRILSLAGNALERIDISAIARPHVEKLVETVRCTVHVGAANGDEILYLVRTDSDKPYRMPSRVGHSIPMHSAGIGKVVLASYTDEELERFVGRAGARPSTPSRPCPSSRRRSTRSGPGAMPSTARRTSPGSSAWQHRSATTQEPSSTA